MNCAFQDPFSFVTKLPTGKRERERKIKNKKIHAQIELDEERDSMNHQSES